MARPKQKECPNCKGTNEKCKYLITGRKCSKGLAKGKAVSDGTKEKREAYDILLGNLHTDYLNDMRNKQIKSLIDEETGELFVKEVSGRTVSFERWLSLNNEKKLATWLRRHVENMEELNFKDFTDSNDITTTEFLEITELGNTELISLMIKACIKNGQDFMNDYIEKVRKMVSDYSKRNMNIAKYQEQLNVLEKIGTVERAKQYFEAKKFYLKENK